MAASKKNYVLGVDIGATKICVGAVTHEGSILRTRTFPTDTRSRDAAIASICGSVEAFLAENGNIYGEPERIGMGVRGYIDWENGIWVRTMMIPNFTSAPLAQILFERFGVRTVMDNDVHAATLAELFFGMGRKCGNFIYINIGSGIAAGIVSERQLLRGVGNFSGEFGHHVSSADIAYPVQAREQCIEELIGGHGLVRRARAALETHPDSVLNTLEKMARLTPSTIFEAYDAGDQLARELVDYGVHMLAIALYNLLGLLNPGALVFGGGVMQDGWLLPRLKAAMALEESPSPSMRLDAFELSSLGPATVGVLGAACVGLEDLRLAPKTRRKRSGAAR